MKMFPRYHLLLAFFLLGAFQTLSAQRFVVNENQKVLKNLSHDVYASGDGKYVELTFIYEDDKISDPVITAYDAKLKEKYSVPFPEISGNAYVTGMYVSKKLYFFVMQTEGTVKRFTINPETGKADGNSTTMFNVDEPGMVKIFKGSSPDSSFNYLLVQNVPRKEKKYTFTGVVLSKSMDVVAKINYNPDEQKSQINDIFTVLSNKGTFSLIYGKEASTKEAYTPYEYSIAQFGLNSLRLHRTISGMPVGDIRHLSWQPVNDELAFNGLLSRHKKKDFTALVSGTFNPASNKLLSVKETEINLPALSDGCSEKAKKLLLDEGISSDAGYDTTFLFPDGSKMILFDIDGWNIYQSHFAPTSSGPGKVSYSKSINSTGNLYVVKINTSGIPEWIRVIGKNQVQGDIRTFLGKIRIADSKNGIHIFFLDFDENDDPETFRKIPTNLSLKKGISLFAVSIASNGKMSKKMVIEGSGNDFRFSPERSFATGVNELFFISMNQKSMNFTQAQLLRRAEFHIGLISVK